MSYITWLLIIIGWIVSFIIARYISKKNTLHADLNNKKETIINLVNSLVEYNITYWSKDNSHSIAHLIMYKLTALGDEIESVEYTQTHSNQLNQLYILFKQEISLNNEFMTDNNLPDDKGTIKLATISSLGRDIIDSVKLLPP